MPDFIDKMREFAVSVNPGLKLKQEQRKANTKTRPVVQPTADTIRIADIARTNLQGAGTAFVRKPVMDAFQGEGPIIDQLTGRAPKVADKSLPDQSPAPVETPGVPVFPGSQIGVQTTPVGRIGSFERRDYTSPQGTATGLRPAGSQRGGYVGALTDAEAERNLQSRFAQDSAAAAIAANADRAIEGIRDTRAAQLGITRERLDVAEGRSDPTALPTRPSFSLPGDTYGDSQLRKNQLESIINDPTAGRNARKQAVDVYDAFITPQNNGAKTDSPVDVQRLLLDRQKLNLDQSNSDRRYTLDRIGVESDVAKNKLEAQKQDRENRDAFIQNFSYPEAGAYTSQLAALAWQLSKSTEGVVPPELVTQYIQKAAIENGIDWENAPPKSLVALGQEAMKLIGKDYRR